jgi:hypothetical protein
MSKRITYEFRPFCQVSRRKVLAAQCVALTALYLRFATAESLNGVSSA